jgi:hypothetical protein
MGAHARVGALAAGLAAAAACALAPAPAPAAAKTGTGIEPLGGVAAQTIELQRPTRPGTTGTAGSVQTDPNALQRPPQLDRPPRFFRLTALRAVAIADRVPKVRRAYRDSPGATRQAFTKGVGRWQVSYYSHDGKEIAQVSIDDATGRVTEAWTGFQVAWTMARGYAGAFGRKVNAPYVWIPLCLLFMVPFVDPRRLRRLLHLDLLVLLAFSVSLYFFNRAEIGTSVPIVYPLLAYLLVRLLVAGLRGRAPREPLRLLVPASWLAVGLVFVLGFRIGLNVTNSNVIDVGYAGVIGADRLADGKPLYGAFPKDNDHGDTYGPVNYEAYVPFEQALPWSGRWDDLPAAHAAAIAFDLLTALGLWLLGRRIRGPTLGLALAYAWATYPFTLFALNTNSNDTLVSALLVGALLVAASAPARGAVVALAGLTKFAPLALAPLFATWDRASDERRSARALLRRVLPFTLAFVAAGFVALAPALRDSGLHEIYDRTLGYQRDRGSPFSIWGYYGGLGGLQTAVQLAAVGLALLVAFVPRRRDLVQVAALGAAVLIALQLGVTHWFYLYLVWFLPFALIALLCAYREPETAAA